MPDFTMKPYDIKELMLLLKDQGMDVTEELAKVILQAVFNWVKLSAMSSDNRIDDVFAGILPHLEPWILEQIDKIDGEVG